MAIIFANEGEININSVITMGVSVKRGRDIEFEMEEANKILPIGRFGSGWKHAVAKLLATGQRFRIYSGLDYYTFDTITQEFRGKNFQVVIMKKNGKNPQQLGFTTELGKHWELWMAYREIWSNMHDEGGECYEASKITPQAGKTFVIVNGQAFEHIHNTRDAFILNRHKKHLLFSNTDVDIYEGKSDCIFYRGMKAKDIKKMPSLFTYNVKREMELTEDRTFKDEYYANVFISTAHTQMENLKVSEEVITAPDKTYEKSLYFDCCYGKTVSPTFKRAIKNARKSLKEVTNTVMTLYHREVTDLADRYNIITLSKMEQAQFERAKAYMHKLGLIPHIDNYPIIFVDSLSLATMGHALTDKDGKKIIINQEAFTRGTKEVAVTLWEEYMHHEFGVADCTRAMQNLLFDTVMNLGEQLIGEPL